MAAVIAGSVRLFNAALSNSQDFMVYWKAVHLWCSGLDPYHYAPEDQGFVFKYPPWMLSLFFPLGWLSYPVARAFWAIAEIGAIFYSVGWMVNHGASVRASLIAAFLYWWMWLAHLSAGQFTLFLLAIGLWSVAKGPMRPVRMAFLVVFFSAKAFSLLTLVGVRRSLFRGKTLWILSGILLASHLGLLSHGPKGLGSFAHWGALYQGWMHAAPSGAAELGEVIVRGPGNHGFTAGVLRWLHVDALSLHWDIVTSLALFIGLGSIWHRFSRKLGFYEQWAGWLALGVITHPLAWHHSFVLTYPLGAFALDRAIKSNQRKLIGLAVIGICCVGVLIPQVIGKDWVAPLEWVSVKSWGVCFCAIALCLAKTAKRSSVA